MGYQPRGIWLLQPAYNEDFHDVAAWSSYNRFVVVVKSRAVEIRETITLNLLTTFEFPLHFPFACLCFSPDSRFLISIEVESRCTDGSY